MSSKQTKQQAQDLLMDNIARAPGYWQEQMASCGRSVEDEAEFRAELKKQADRVAKLFGFDEAWAG